MGAIILWVALLVAFSHNVLAVLIKNNKSQRWGARLIINTSQNLKQKNKSHFFSK